MSAKHKKKTAVHLSKVQLAAYRKKEAAFQKRVLKQLKLVREAPPNTYKMSVFLCHEKAPGKIENIIIHYPPPNFS
jgi:hypothetical protein